MLAIFFCIGIFFLTLTEEVPTCPNHGLPVINMCEAGSMVKPSLLMDFSLAEHLSVTTCHCEVLVIEGKQFHFSQVIAPGYVGCGSEIHIQKNDKPHSGDVIPCYGGTTVSGLREGNTLKIKLMKHNSPYDVQYCYRLDITGSPSAAMSVTCYQEIIEQTLPTSTEQINSTYGSTTSAQTDDVTTDPPTTTQSDDFSYNKNISLAPYVDNRQCNQSTLYTVIAVLLVFLTVVACYAAMITFKYFTRDNVKSDKLPENNDIYEEIPAGNYLSSFPVYETEVQQRRCSRCHNSNSRTMQSNIDGHWNWTYDEQRSHDTHYEKPNGNPPHTYEYEVAKF